MTLYKFQIKHSKSSKPWNKKSVFGVVNNKIKADNGLYPNSRLLSRTKLKISEIFKDCKCQSTSNMYLYVNNVQNYQFSNSTLPCRALILLHRDSNSRQHTEHQNKGQGISRNACDITDWSPKQMFDQIGASVKWRTQFMFIYQYLTSY